MITLPLGATEGMLVGGPDLERLLAAGERRVVPGILGRAHGGYLYVDEVNLAQDHLLDCLLDVSEAGICRVERDGISVHHPARFTLLASMDPEEGELRPQILDRFGLCVEMEAEAEERSRVEVMKRSLALSEAPQEFLRDWRREMERERARIEAARRLLATVHVPREVVKAICAACSKRQAAGNRAEIIWLLAAQAAAAYRGREEATLEDAAGVADLVLLHRGREQDCPPSRESRAAVGNRFRASCEPAALETECFRRGDLTNDQSSAQPVSLRPTNEKTAVGTGILHSKSRDLERHEQVLAGVPPDVVQTQMAAPAIDITPIPNLRVGRDRRKRERTGRGGPTKTSRRAGRMVGSQPAPPYHDVAFAATLRAAAPHQKERRWSSRRPPEEDLAVIIKPCDVRRKVREARRSDLLIFVVDASGSMGQQLVSLAKGAIIRLLADAYQRRDKVALVIFRGRQAKTLLPPTTSVERAKRRLDVMETGGRTPLAAGLLEGWRVAKRVLRQNTEVGVLMILISDGKANVSFEWSREAQDGDMATAIRELDRIAEAIRRDGRIDSLVLDTQEHPYVPSEQARRIARYMGARYVRLRSTVPESVIDHVAPYALGVKS
jgi:magnesium chelatase subunit D